MIDYPYLLERRLFGPYTCRVGGCPDDATHVVNMPATIHWPEPRIVWTPILYCPFHAMRTIAHGNPNDFHAMRTIAHGNPNDLPRDKRMRKLYTTAEAAKALGLSQVRVRQLCQDGRLGKKYGTYWLVTDAEIKAYRPAATGRPRKEATQ